MPFYTGFGHSTQSRGPLELTILLSVRISVRKCHILTYAEATREQGYNTLGTLYAADRRVSITIYPGLPAQVEVVHAGLTKVEVEAVLMDMAKADTSLSLWGNIPGTFLLLLALMRGYRA